MRKHIHFLAGAALAAFLAIAASCGNGHREADTAGNDTMFQTATLQSLMMGNYDGFVSIGQLLSCGNHGLGTFERADGEMIILDGTVYQAKADGNVSVANDKMTSPFAISTHFDNDISFTVEGTVCLDSLLSRMTEVTDSCGANFIYAVRIDVDGCDSVRFRSVLPQQKPYKPLAKALETDQREFTDYNVAGTVVGVFFPSYLGQINAAGWHCHFISADRTRGGHLLDISFPTKAEVQLDLTPDFALHMPEDESFSNAELDRDLSSEIEAVEK